MSPFIAEIIGTMVLMLLGTGVNANTSLDKTYGKGSGWIVTTFGWAMAVFVAVLISMDYSGAHLNPAVSIGLAAAGKFEWGQVLWYIPAQLIGAMLGSGLAWAMYAKHYEITEDANTMLGTFSTSPAISDMGSNFLSEVLGTFILIFAVLYITGPNFSPAQVDTPAGLGSLGALPVGLIVLSIGLSLGGSTGYAINPARDLGPRIMHYLLPIQGKRDSNWRYAWVPIVGPIVGGLVAAALYMVLR